MKKKLFLFRTLCLSLMLLATGMVNAQETQYVAKINSTQYATLSEAFEAANKASTTTTIYLLQDATINTTYTVNNIKNAIIAFRTNGHNLTANVPFVDIHTSFNYIGATKGITTVPSDADFFTIQPEGKLVGLTGIFNSTAPEKFLDSSLQYMKNKGNGTYEVTKWSNNDAIAAGHILSAMWNTTEGPHYFKTIEDWVVYAKANNHTGTEIKLLVDITNVTWNVNDCPLKISLNNKNFTGSIVSEAIVGVLSGGTADFINLVTPRFTIDVNAQAIIKDGNVATLDNLSKKTTKLIIQGGTFGKDPTEYLATGCIAKKNEDNTYKVILGAHLNAFGYATYCAAIPFRTRADQEIITYIAKVDGEKIEFTEINDVAAGVGVFLAGTPDMDVEFERIEDNEGVNPGDANDLKAAMESVSDYGSWAYGLSGDKFHHLTFGTLPKARAYFDLEENPLQNEPAGAAFRFVFPNNPTSPTVTSTEEITTTKTTKNLINGKIIIVRRGITYDVNGKILKPLVSGKKYR